MKLDRWIRLRPVRWSKCTCFFEFTSVFKMLPFFAGAFKDAAINAFFPYITRIREARRQKFVDNILNKLSNDYDPDVKPKFGPVFQRGNWKQEFLRRAHSDMYLCYYGASDIGKSVAICDALKNRKGVVYLPLRKANEHQIAQIFATQIGISLMNYIR